MNVSALPVVVFLSQAALFNTTFHDVLQHVMLLLAHTDDKAYMNEQEQQEYISFQYYLFYVVLSTTNFNTLSRLHMFLLLELRLECLSPDTNRVLVVGSGPGQLAHHLRMLQVLSFAHSSYLYLLI